MRRFPPSPITRLVDTTPVYNLGESTCRDLTIEELLDGDAGRLARLALGYGSSAGDSELRQLVADSAGVAPDQVLITGGAAAALSLLAVVFADGVGEIVVGRPCFPPALDLLRSFGAPVRMVRTTFEDGYRLDLDAFAGSLSSRTRLVLLASPQNPSGVRVSRDEVTGLLSAMSLTCPRALLVIDETYREAVYGTAPVPPSYASLSPQVVTCASLSKAHGAPGVRIGWLTVPDAALYDQLRLAKFNMSISAGAVDEFLAVELLRRADTLLAPQRAFLADALAVVAEWAVGTDTIRWVRPDAGAMCCIRLELGVREPEAARALVAELTDRGVLVAPGEWFGDASDVVRIGFGYEPLVGLRAGLDIVRHALTATADS